DPVDLGHDPAPERHEAVAPGFEGPQAAAERFFIEGLEVIAEGGEDLFAGHSRAYFGFDAGGNSGNLLVVVRVDVDVDPHADDGREPVGQVVDLDENTGDLAAIDEDIVRPLQVRRDPLANCGTHFLDGRRNSKRRDI